MTLKKMEKTKLFLDIGITVFGLLAALFATLSFVYSSRIENVKKIEDERLKSKIAESNAFAAKAKEEAAKAFSSAANTNEKAKKLELLIEEQKERAANAEESLIKLKNKIKPRTISIDNANKIITELKKQKNKNIVITSSLGDGEASLYANQFINIFELAGWKVDAGAGFSTFTGIGVYLMTKTNDDLDAKKLKNIFKMSGINLQEQVMEEMTLQIFIGSKNDID